MQICIDATSLLLRSAGVKNYTWHWMESLKREAPGDEIRAFPMLGDVGALHHDRSMLSFRETLPRIALLHACNIRGSRLIDLVAGRADVFHASSLLRNLPRRPKLTGTLYDMTARLMPEVHTPGNIRAEASYFDRVLSKADGLIAISQSTKDDAVRFGLNPDRISVIYPGIDERFFNAKPHVREKPYVLFLGTLEPRKNVETLLDAWERLRPDLRKAFDLLLAGPTGWASEQTQRRIEAGMEGVRRTGYIPEEDLPSFTAGASAFVYPSLYEGFGFPLAQAMAAGVACITSNVSSLPEVAGDGALLVEPKDATALATALTKVLDSPGLRADLGEKARRHAGQFTWVNSARQSIEFFRSLQL